MMFFCLSLVLCGMAAGSSAGAPLLSCDTPIGGAVNNDSAAVGTWFLIHCYTTTSAKCTEKNCLRFDLTRPEERKQLSDVYGSRLADVKWDAVVLKIVTPCPAAEEPVPTPNYLEKTAPGAFRLITLPLLGAKPTAKMPKPRPIRLELVKGQFLVMLDCLDLEPVLMVQRAPAPGYRDDPVIGSLLEYSEY